MQKLLLIFISILAVSCSSSKEVSTTNTSKKIPFSMSDMDEKQRISFEKAFFSGNKEKLLGNYLEAEKDFQKCLEIYPYSAIGHYEMALIQDFKKDLPGAISYMEKAVEYADTNVWYRKYLIDLYYATGSFEKAIKNYDILLETDPLNVDYKIQKALVQKKGGKVKDAIKTYDNIEEQIGVNKESSVHKHRLHIQMNDYEKAELELDKLIKTFPSSTEYYGMKAKLLMIQGKEDEAISVYEKIEELDPNNPTVQLSLADYYDRAGEDEKAHNMMLSAFSNPAMIIETKLKLLLNGYLSISDINPERRKEGIELCDTLLKTHGDDSRALALYGDFLHRDNKLEDAAQAYEKSLKLDKSQFLVWQQVMFVYSEQNKFNKIIEKSEEAMSLFPTQPIFYYFNGTSNLQKENYTKAISALSAGKEIIIDNPPLLEQFYAYLGEAYYNTEQYNLSDTFYNKALGLNPDNLTVLNNYSYYLSIREELLPKAREMSKKSNELSPNNPTFMDTYSWVLYKLGEYDEAANWMKKAIDLDEEKDGTLLEHYGDILFKQGNSNIALEYWKKAVEKGESSDSLHKKIKSGKLE